MRILVAHLTDPLRDHLEPGEPVWLVDPCRESRRRPYGGCPCGIAFRGLRSDGHGFTARVVDVPGLDVAGYADGFWRAQARHVGCSCVLREEMPAELLVHAAGWPVGTILRRELGTLVPVSRPSGFWARGPRDVV